MKYPTLSELNRDREMIDVFKGYNHNLRIGEGEFYEMTNLSSDNYPVLSPRKRRGVYLDGGSVGPTIQGIIEKDSLCYVRGGNFVINKNESTAPALNLTNTGEKTLISMGAYVIIMPDKKYINTIPKKDDDGNDVYDYGDIEARIKSSSSTFTICSLQSRRCCTR